MKLSDCQYEEIKNEVIDLFMRCDINSIPISVYNLAVKLGILLIPFSSLSESKLAIAKEISSDGFYIEPGNGKEYIFYNDQINSDRSKMTILHEIGHCILGHTDEMNPEEAEAEARFFFLFAAAPPPLIHLIKPSTPEDIENAFAISREAAVYAFNYYKKWLRIYCTTESLCSYEQLLVHQFTQIGINCAA